MDQAQEINQEHLPIGVGQLIQDIYEKALKTTKQVAKDTLLTCSRTEEQ